jgi:hypothetical protein
MLQLRRLPAAHHRCGEQRAHQHAATPQMAKKKTKKKKTDSQELEAEMVSLSGHAEAAEPVEQVPAAQPGAAEAADLTQMPPPSRQDTAVRALVGVLLQQPVLTEEAASSASRALGRMAKDDDSLSLAIAQSDGVLGALSNVCNTAASDGARAAAAESLGILASNDANKVAIRCTAGSCRGLIRVCNKAVERVERRATLTVTVEQATLAINAVTATEPSEPATQDGHVGQQATELTELQLARTVRDKAYDVCMSTGRSALTESVAALTESVADLKRAETERKSAGLELDQRASEELRTTLGYLRRQRKQAKHALQSDEDREPAAAAAAAMVSGARTLAILMESTAAPELADKTLKACEERVEYLHAQVQKATAVVAAAESSVPATQDGHTGLQDTEEEFSATLVGCRLGAIATAAREALQGKQRELQLARTVREKAHAVCVSTSRSALTETVAALTESAADLKTKVSHLTNLGAQLQQVADASSVKLLQHQQRQRWLRHPTIISWVPCGMPRQAGAHLARVPRQSDQVDPGPMQKEYEALAHDELSRLSSAHPPPGFLGKMKDSARAADLMVLTLEAVRMRGSH